MLSFGFNTNSSNSTKVDFYKNIVQLIFQKNLNKIKILINSEKLTKDDFKLLLDDYGNTLLHLAVDVKYLEAIKYFLEIGIDHNQKNKIDKSSWTNAIISHDEKIINIFINHLKIVNNNEIDLLKKKHSDISKKFVFITNENNELKIVNNNEIDLLKKKHSDISEKFVSITNENNELKIRNKRLRENNDDLKVDNNYLILENKKLKTENNDLANEKNNINMIKIKNEKLTIENNNLITENNKLKIDKSNLIEITKTLKQLQKKN